MQRASLLAWPHPAEAFILEVLEGVSKASFKHEREQKYALTELNISRNKVLL